MTSLPSRVAVPATDHRHHSDQQEYLEGRPHEEQVLPDRGREIERMQKHLLNK